MESLTTSVITSMLINTIILFAATVLLYFPFIAWPPDPHFGSNSIWALFRKPGESLPKEVVLGNAGYSRIFLHYIVLFIVLILGRKHLHLHVRAFQAISFFLTATAISTLGQEYLGIQPPFALTAGLMLLFCISRPQLQPTYMNAEPYYVLAQALGMACLLAGLTMNHPTLGLGLYSLILSFAAMNTKSPFTAEALTVGLVFLLVNDNKIQNITVLCIGILGGTTLFLILMRRHLYFGASDLMKSYHSMFRGGLRVLRKNFKRRWKNGLDRSPLGGVALLAVIGILLPPWNTVWLLITTWLAVTTLLLVLQFRFELYHFIIILPAASLLAGRALSLTWEVHPMLCFLMVGAALLLALKSLRDFPFYYGKNTVEEKMSRALPTVFQHYCDLRMQSVVNHFHSVKNPGEKFVAWGIVPQLYYMADTAPVSTYTFFHHWMEVLYPPWKNILFADLKASHPRWLYDFSTWNKDHGRFNPLTMFAATGLSYLPHARFQNIVCFRRTERMGIQTIDVGVDNTWPIYVRFTPTLDFIRHELGLRRKDPLPLDLPELTVSLLNEDQSSPPEMEADFLLSRLEKTTPWGVLESYGAAFMLQRGNTKKANELLNRECLFINSMSMLHAPLAIAREALRRKAGGATTFLRINADSINRLSAPDALAFIRLIRAMLKAGLLHKGEKEITLQTIQEIGIDRGAWRDEEIESNLITEVSIIIEILLQMGVDHKMGQSR